MRDIDRKGILDLAGILISIEKQYGLVRGFLPALLQEDDWSFIIKMHALVEAVVSDSLSTAIDKRLTGIFSRLELSESRSGKTQFAAARDLITEDQKTFIRKLSEIRNIAVHDIRNVSLNLQEYVTGLDPNQRSSLVDAIVRLFNATIREQWKTDTMKDIKSSLWAATMVMIGRATTSARIEKSRKELLNASYKYVKALKDADSSVTK